MLSMLYTFQSQQHDFDHNVSLQDNVMIGLLFFQLEDEAKGWIVQLHYCTKLSYKPCSSKWSDSTHDT